MGRRSDKLCVLVLAALSAVGCGDREVPFDVAFEDAGRAMAPDCADRAEVFAFPSPVWVGAEGLRLPDDDAAGRAVLGLGWEHEITSLDGWPRRPTWIVPLDRSAGRLDPTRAVVAVGAGRVVLDVPVRVEAPTPRTLSVTPRDPLPFDARSVVLALRPGVAGAARALPICDANGMPHPEQVALANSLDGDIDVAIELTLADGSLALVALQDRLAATPAVVVESSEAISVADFDERAPSPEDAPSFQSTALRGVLALPDYRVDDAPMVIAEDGAPVAQGTTRPSFLVVLPRSGSVPYPVILFQHGGGQSPLDVFGFGAQLADAGFAFVSIDLPEHGNRAGALGGGDLDFIDFGSPLNTRENFRQAAADHLAVLNGLDAIEAEVETHLGVADALDETRRFYIGHSLGAVSGSLTTASSRGLLASALFAAGAGYPELMSFGPFAVAAARALRGPEPRPATVLAIVETILDGGDPLAYAIAAEDRAAPPVPMLFLQAIDDPLIAHLATEQWARAFGARLARPVEYSAEGLLEVDLPAAETFAFEEGGPLATRVLIQNPMNDLSPSMRHGELILTDYAQRLVTHCFVSARDDGSCEVIDTGFRDR